MRYLSGLGWLGLLSGLILSLMILGALLIPVSHAAAESPSRVHATRPMADNAGRLSSLKETSKADPQISSSAAMTNQSGTSAALTVEMPYTPSIRIPAPISATGHTLPLLGEVTDVDAFNEPLPSPGFQGEFQLSVLSADSSQVSAQMATVVIVNTTSMVIDGNTNSVDDLINEPSPDPPNNNEISLAEALQAVNNTGPGFTIAFDGAELPHGSTINFNNSLFLTAGGTIIDGDTNNDSKPDIVLNGPTGFISLGIVSPNNETRHLAITGLTIQGAGANNNKVIGSYLGTDVEGRVARPRQVNGLTITNGASNNVIENNIIAGNTGNAGILINSGAQSNQVLGNRIGLNIDGNVLANQSGISIQNGSVQNIIGGSDRTGTVCDGSCNIISGNTEFGVRITGTGTSGNKVQGNFIGTNPSGTAAVPNNLSGIIIRLGATQNFIGENRQSEQCNGPCNVISGNRQAGILIAEPGTDNNEVRGNYIGLNASGSATLPNNITGVTIVAGASQNIIGGDRQQAVQCQGPCNIISGNNSSGIVLEGAGTAGNKVQGNYIGVNPAGTLPIANASSGILVRDQAQQNLIGDERASVACNSFCNVISGNGQAGIGLTDPGTDNNLVRGNYIGVNAAGTIGVPNTLSGIVVQNQAEQNIIGGGNRNLRTCVGPCNVISGNREAGVTFLDTGTSSNQVQGNYIGVNALGTSALGNWLSGVIIRLGATENTIGGERSGTDCNGLCNLISGNLEAGVAVIGAGTNNNILQGNFIGVDRTGTAPIANTIFGVVFESGASDNLVGLELGEKRNDKECIGVCNIISHNLEGGVLVVHSNDPPLRNTIRGNAFFENEGLGIDLAVGPGGIGVSFNDQDDGDSGPNDLMNFPMGVTAVYDFSSDSTRISGTLDTSNPESATIDIYASDKIDPSGYGEGEYYLGSTKPNKDGEFELSISGKLTYRFLSATATDSNGSTSEFSPRPPLIFIPGIAGSDLIDGLDGLKLWHPLHFDKADNPPPVRVLRLSLYDEIPTPSPLIYAPDIMRSGITKIYTSLIENLVNEGGFKEYVIDGDVSRLSQSGCDVSQQSQYPSLFLFPYDWRKSNVQNAQALKDYVACIRRFYPDSQIDILTHSMGSLLARRYIIANHNAGTEHHVNKLVTVGAPWLGAPKLAYVLETGHFLPLNFFSNEIKYVIGSFSGAHELVAAQTYYNSLGGPPLFEAGWDLDGDGHAVEQYTYADYIAILDKRYGKNQYDPGTTGDTFHQGLQDDWKNDPTGVRYFHIYGEQDKLDTIGRVAATHNLRCHTEQGAKICFRDKFFSIKPFLTLGDGTVPTLSAARLGSAVPPNVCFIRFTGAQSGSDELVEHNGLNNNGLVHETVHSLLGSGHSPYPSSSCTPSSSSAPVHQVAVSSLQYLTIFGGTSITVHDTKGNNTAPVSETLRGEVPGVTTYFIGNNAELDMFPTTGTYSATFQTTGEPLALELTTGTSDTATRAIRYQDLSLPAGVTAMLKIKDQGPDMLRYDSDGDGSFETTVTPTVDISGPQANDLEPPVITIQAVKQQDIVEATLSAQDSGSGVKVIFYSLDGTNFQPYTTQLQVDPTQTPILYAFADDKVANRATLVYPLSLAQPPAGSQIYLPIILKSSN